MIEIRHAIPDDTPSVLNVWLEADAESTVTDDEVAVRALLDHAPDAVLLAVQGDRIVGTVIVGWDGWRGSFYRLAVVPDRRRQGIARQLVSVGERQLIDMGAVRIALFAVTVYPAAVDFWTSLGYLAQSDRQRLVKNIPAAG